jgi:hypothetical protein
MLNIARLLKLASGAQVEPDPTYPTRPDHEKHKSGQQNPGETRANPTDPTYPTKNTIGSENLEVGPSPTQKSYFTPVTVRSGGKGALPVSWYHPEGGGDFCWKVNRAWWEEPYQAAMNERANPCPSAWTVSKTN